MKISDFFKNSDLEKTVLIGYYGGGNYGDELLMEVLSNLFRQRGVREVSIAYQSPQTFSTYHHDFGYTILPAANKAGLLKAIIKNKHIVIGGGGLWGLDVNLNIFLLSLLLFVSRWVFGKKVYLLGVGYYNSTSTLGHISAFLAAKAASTIFGRDDETISNFSKLNGKVFLDTDIAWYLKDVGLSTYAQELAKLETALPITPGSKTAFITLRRFKEENGYATAVERYIKENSGQPIIAAIMEPKGVDPEGYRCIRSWETQYRNVVALDFAYNPIALYLFFKKHKSNLLFVGPQFHGIISAYLNNVPYFPMTYDNKVTQLLEGIQPNDQPIPLHQVTAAHIKQFIDGTLLGREIG